jgi:hypothetical protein
VVHSCNSNTKEAKAGEFRVLGQPGLQDETLSQKTNTKGRKKKKNKGAEALFMKFTNVPF